MKKDINMEKCEISMKVKNKGTGKIQRLTVTYQGPKRQYYDVLLKYKKKSKNDGVSI